MSPAPTVIGPSVNTRKAAQYLTENGLKTSLSTLQKMRGRGQDDPRDRGPDFFRDTAGLCWYPVKGLDRYIKQRLSGLKFRAPAPQPANFRRATA